MTPETKMIEIVASIRASHAKLYLALAVLALACGGGSPREQSTESVACSTPDVAHVLRHDAAVSGGQHLTVVTDALVEDGAKGHVVVTFFGLYPRNETTLVTVSATAWTTYGVEAVAPEGTTAAWVSIWADCSEAGAGQITLRNLDIEVAP